MATLPAARSTEVIREHLASRIMPVSSLRDRQLGLCEPLKPLFPGGILQRGTVIRVDCDRSAGPRPEAPPRTGGATSLAFTLLASASSSGAWCAAVGTPDTGINALAELGVDLGHLAIVPLSPLAALSSSARSGCDWPEVASLFLDGMDVVLLKPRWPARPHVARRLAARARDRQAVIVVLATRAWWPEGPDVHLEVTRSSWQGIGRGHGHLLRRHLEVRARGRRGAVRPVTTALWLPRSSGAAGST